MARRPRASTWVARALVLLVAAIVVRVLREPYLLRNVTPGAEGQLGVRYWEIARTSFIRGDGYPLWDNSQCGGWPFLGNPDTPLLSAAFAGIFHVHGDVMSRWMITLWMLAGVLGGYAWARHALSLGRIASLFAGALFVSSTFVAFELTHRSHFLPFAAIPWVLFFARLGEKDVRASLACGATLALMVIEGGVLFPLAAALVALLVAELPRLAKLATWRNLGIALASFVMLAGVKLVPVAQQFARHPRVVREADHMTLQQIVTVLGESELTRALGTGYHRDEYHAYVGALAIGMAIAGAGTALILKPRRLDVALLVMAGLLLARGVFGPYAPYVMLSKLPLYSQLAVPSRWLGLLDLAIAGAAAIALHEGMKAVKRPALVALLVVVACLAVYDASQAARKVSQLYPPNAFLPRPDPPPQPHRWSATEDLGKRAELPARNVGVLNCYKLGLEYPEASGYALGPVAQASVDAGAGTVAAEVRQDRIELDLDLRRPAIVRINSNFDPDFHASIGELRRGPTGLLELAAPAGKQHVVVAYRPKGLWPGLSLTLLGVACSIVAVVALRRRSGRLVAHQ